MQNLNLNDLLRYGFAGAVFILLAVFAFEEPRTLVVNKDVTGTLVALSTAAALTIGCVIYAVHRAIPYPLLYQLFKLLTGRTESTLELDVQRWKNGSKDKALQPRLADWAAQIHFLYCITWSSSASLLTGGALGWKKNPSYGAVWWLVAAFASAALLHHYRYQRWERRIFTEDAKLPEATARQAQGDG